ncbi:MAG: peroxiredoxin family protein [Armatimonadota bacterium]
MKRPDLARLWSLLIWECRIAARGPTFWGLAGACALLGLWRASAHGTTAALAAYRACEALLIGLGVLAVFLAGTSAGRDRRTVAEQSVLSKPEGSAPSIPLLRFAALWLSLLAIAAIGLLGASLGQLLFAHTAWALYPYLNALGRIALPVGAAAALGFSLSTAFHTPLASAAAAVYWLVIPLSRPHLAAVFDLTLSQHWPAAALAMAFLVALSSAVYGRAARDRGPRSRRPALLAAALLLATGLAVYRLAASGDDFLTGPDPILSAVQSQSLEADARAPGFWLRDAHGRFVGLNDFAGHPVVLLFWGPAVTSSAALLSDLREVAKEFDARGVRCLAVCVDRDPAAMRPFAAEVGPRVTMLWDRGLHFGQGGYADDSPLAVSYGVTELPSVYLLDSSRRLVAQASAQVDRQWLTSKLEGIVGR